ncbi:hypothetical protein [Pseudomonas chlororaphis]
MSKSFVSQEQRDSFKALIIKHVAEDLPEDEWISLRQLALGGFAGVRPYPMVDPDDTPEKVIIENICVENGEDIDSIVEQYAVGHGVSVTEIGFIEGRPVLYLEGTGIYLWDPKGPTGHYLSFWISFPAYPPSW